MQIVCRRDEDQPPRGSVPDGAGLCRFSAGDPGPRPARAAGPGGRPRPGDLRGTLHQAGQPAGDGRQLLAIDHVLTGRQCAVITKSAHRLPGSDHRALYAELRLLLSG